MLCLLLPVDPSWLGLLCPLLVNCLRLLLGNSNVTVAFTALVITVGSEVSQPASLQTSQRLLFEHGQQTLCAVKSCATSASF